MRIVIVGSYPLSADLIKGGVESSVFGLANELSKENVVDVLDYPRIGGRDLIEQCGKFAIHRYANIGKHNRDASLREKDIIRDIIALHPDVIHIHGSGQLSLAIYNATSDYGIKTIVTIHGLVHEEKKKALRKCPTPKLLYQYIYQSRIEMKLLDVVEYVIVDTLYVANRIRHYYSKGRIKHLPRIYVIPQGISSEYFNINCDERNTILLSVGAMSPRKGHLLTLEAYQLLRAHGTQAKLRILGSLADKKHYSKLLDTISKNPYKEDISLETNVSQQELYDAYKSANIFVLHSEEESQGIVFAEAMATGMPIVATKVGGIEDIVESGKTGFLCEYGDTETMAEMIERLLTDRKLWKMFSLYAKQISHAYDWQEIGKQIVQLYNV